MKDHLYVYTKNPYNLENKKVDPYKYTKKVKDASCEMAPKVGVMELEKTVVEEAPVEFHPDYYLNFKDIVEKYGYQYECHSVTTEDGYILTM